MGRLKTNDEKLKHLCTGAEMCEWKVEMIWSALNQGEDCRAAVIPDPSLFGLQSALGSHQDSGL